MRWLPAAPPRDFAPRPPSPTGGWSRRWRASHHQVRCPAWFGSVRLSAGREVAADRARQAAGPPPTAAELTARNPDDLDSRLLESRVGLDVAFVGNGEARRDGERVVAVVPLLAFRGHRVEAGVDDAQRVDAHRFGRSDEERLGRS